MPPYSGSLISSSLFTSAQIRDSPSGTQNFILKGEGKIGSYEKIGGSDDLYNVFTSSGTCQLSITALKEGLQELKQYASVSVNNLDPIRTEIFRSIVESLRLLFGAQTLYELVLEKIREVFADIAAVRPGTVAAYFIGCFSDDKFTGPLGCSPKCAASLPPLEGTPGYSTCDDLVLIYSDGMFNSLNDKRSEHIYIHVEGSDFKGFSPENIKQLQDADIKRATLVFGNADGSYREITGALPIDQLPLKNAVATPSVAQTTSTSATTTSTDTSAAGIILAVIIIIILIILLFVVMRA